MDIEAYFKEKEKVEKGKDERKGEKEEKDKA